MFWRDAVQRDLRPLRLFARRTRAVDRGRIRSRRRRGPTLGIAVEPSYNAVLVAMLAFVAMAWSGTRVRPLRFRERVARAWGQVNDFAIQRADGVLNEREMQSGGDLT